MKRLKFWTGTEIEKPDPVKHKNCVLVYGSNPTGYNSKGAALTAREYWGAGHGAGHGRGLHGNAYGLVTKNLKKDYFEPETGITYKRYGRFSVSKQMIRANIEEMYAFCLTRPDLKFIIPYQKSSDNLNGYSSIEMFILFTKGIEVPSNVYFHESFKGFVVN